MSVLFVKKRKCKGGGEARSGTGYAIRNDPEWGTQSGTGERVGGGGVSCENFGKCKGGGGGAGNGGTPGRGTQSSPERGEGVREWRCFFVKKKENVRLGGGGGRDPEQGTQSGTRGARSGTGYAIWNGGRGAGVADPETGYAPERVGARSGTGYAIQNGGRG